jgi:predicted acetyltransferase
MVAVTFRPARATDLDRLVAIHTVAFPDERGHDVRIRNFQDNPWATLDELHVALEGDRILAHGFLFAMEAFVDGRPIPIGGIATIGVAPEARGRGIGTQLLAHLHRLSDERGDALTLLYPFRYAFYARLGYVALPPLARWSIDPRAIPVSRGEGVAAPELAVDRSALDGIYRADAVHRHLCLERPAALWNRRVSAERTQFLQWPDGYVAFEARQAESHGATTVVVLDWVAQGTSSVATLWNVLARMGDQAATIELETATDDPMIRGLSDIDGDRSGTLEVEHAFGTLVGAGMIRCGSFERALGHRRFAEDMSLSIRVDDHIWRVTVSAGVANAEPLPPSSSADVVFDRRAATACLFGGLRVSEAVTLGWARGTKGTLDGLERLLAHPKPGVLDRF